MRTGRASRARRSCWWRRLARDASQLTRLVRPGSHGVAGVHPETRLGRRLLAGRPGGGATGAAANAGGRELAEGRGDDPLRSVEATAVTSARQARRASFHDQS